MRNTVKIALGAMLTALSTAIMMAASLIPFLTYAIPAMAGLAILFIRIECNWKWALGVYFATSVICALLVPEKEAVGIYIVLFGYYPLLQPIFDKPKKVISYLIKSVYFILVIVAAYIVMMRVFGISVDLLEDSSVYILPVLVVLGLVAFLCYDRALFKLEIMYYHKYQKRVRKIIRK